MLALAAELAEQANLGDSTDQWPAAQLELCAKYGVFRWFLTQPWGGFDWPLADVIKGYLALSEACLTTTFIITQRTAACRRLAASFNEPLKQELLPKLASGKLFASVGISHLTTSRLHMSQPVLRARPLGDGYVLDGYSPWVTGGKYCDWIVTGATLEDGRQILAAVPGDAPGVRCSAPAQLTALSASCTGSVHFNEVLIPGAWLLDGPMESIMTKGTGGNTGGLETSTLALGLASAAITFIEDESQQRNYLTPASMALREEQVALRYEILAVAAGKQVCSNEDIRSRANSLVLRSTQSALAAAKGAGFVVGHPAGRWCREALFFLVWSCPQPVMQAALCELAGLGSE